MNIINIIWAAIKAIWNLTVTGARTTGQTIWRIAKRVFAIIRLYAAASSTEKKAQKAAFIASLKKWGVSAVLTVSAGFVIWSVYNATIGKILQFLPVFVLDAAGYLAVMLLLDAAVKSARRMGLREDIVGSMQKIVSFGINAFIPWLILVCFRNPSDQNVLMLSSSYIACAAYGKIRQKGTKPVTPVPVPAKA